MKFVNCMQVLTGKWQAVTQHGASIFDAWRDCWVVFKTAALMEKIATQSTIDRYATHFEERGIMFSQAWGLCVVSNIRCRPEFWVEEDSRQVEWHRTKPQLSIFDPRRTLEQRHSRGGYK